MSIISVPPMLVQRKVKKDKEKKHEMQQSEMLP